MILITAPHSKCPPSPSEERFCDTVARYAAESLFNQFLQQGHNLENGHSPGRVTNGHSPGRVTNGHSPGRVDLFLGTEYRNLHDLNRESSRNTYYRKILSEYMSYIPPTSGKKILLDIHSFPLDFFRDSLDGNLRDYQNPSLIILDNLSTYNNYSHLIPSLNQYLISSGIDSAIVEGSDVNDIVLESIDYGFPAILLEFSENLNPHEIDKITSHIHQWVRIVMI